MTIVARYVFRQTTGALLLILLSLSGIVWIALALRQLNVVTAQGQDAWMLLSMTTLALPNLMALIAPIALLIAAIHTLNRLSGDSELIVLTAAGGTIWNVARPLLLLALLVSLAVGSVNHVAMPWSLRLLRDLVIQMRTDLLTQVIQPGRFTTPETNLTFHIRDRALNGELQGILLHDVRDPKQSLSYLAERGTIIKQGSASYLLMSQGHIIRRPDPNEPAQIVAFERYPIDLDRFEAKEITGDLKPRERYLSELLAPNPSDPVFRNAPGQYAAELHERFSNPLYPFAFVLLALGLAGQAESTRHSRMRSVVLAFLLAVGIRLGGLAVNNLVVLKPLAFPLLYALPLGGILVGLTLIGAGSKGRGSAGRFSAADALGGLWSAFRAPALAAPAGRHGRR